jgi:hypothetical protein
LIFWFRSGTFWIGASHNPQHNTVMIAKTNPGIIHLI